MWLHSEAAWCASDSTKWIETVGDVEVRILWLAELCHKLKMVRLKHRPLMYWAGVSLRKNGHYGILMLKIAKDSKSFHHLLLTVTTDICWTGRMSPKLIRWKQPLIVSNRRMPKHRWIYVQIGATVLGTVQNNEVFILFTLITLGSRVASWTLLLLLKSKFDPVFPYSIKSVFVLVWFGFCEMLTVSPLFRKILFCPENFHCFKKIEQIERKQMSNRWMT